jgi:hypothetical protein
MWKAAETWNCLGVGRKFLEMITPQSEAGQILFLCLNVVSTLVIKVNARDSHERSFKLGQGMLSLDVLDPWEFLQLKSTAVSCLPCSCPSHIPNIAIFTTDYSGSPSLPPV